MAHSTMLGRTWTIFTLAIVVCCAREAVGADTTPQAVSIKISELAPSGWDTEHRRTLAFLSDDLVAVLLCGLKGMTGCRLVLAEFSSDKIAVRKEVTIPGAPSEIRRVGEQGILITFNYRTIHRLYSTDLRFLQDLPTLFQISITGTTMALGSKEGHIGIYRFDGASMSKIGVLMGGEEPEAVSEEYVVLREGNTIVTKTIDGDSRGAFKVKPPTKCGTVVELAGNAKLYLQSCGPDSMVDFQGKRLSRFKSPDGSGWRRGWSEDGRCLLYDHYTHHVSFLRRAGEDALAIATLGMGVADEGANGEMIRGVDTATGDTCFELSSPARPAVQYDYHADVSPSGKYVAVITDDALWIYTLPESCGKK